MVYRLSFADHRDFSAVPETVYAAILSPKMISEDRNAVGAFLSIKRIWGTPGLTGSQHIARISWGMADLVMTETILLADPYKAIKLSQRPDRFLPYDPAERLAFLNRDVPKNLDKLFAKTYGTPPVTTEIQFDLDPVKSGTNLRVTVDARLATKPGYFKRKRWLKGAPKEVSLIFAGIDAAISTALPPTSSNG